MQMFAGRLPKWFGERPGKKSGDPDTPEEEELKKNEEDEEEPFGLDEEEAEEEVSADGYPAMLGRTISKIRIVIKYSYTFKCFYLFNNIRLKKRKKKKRKRRKKKRKRKRKKKRRKRKRRKKKNN